MGYLVLLFSCPKENINTMLGFVLAMCIFGHASWWWFLAAFAIGVMYNATYAMLLRYIWNR